ncbi:uncharacterized mitochondrial protein AtMg00810-like [Prosopis cineraria]|uniref:uncharacterized mitochondrial protein AtMg00810-like n=1 Tax=Prosopis cineraria TaxID=364024 RepID=UPI00240EA72C|nr:uncharacterized mitochondrial protein AtMg00810-like [Prosopis cineraria]
MNNIKSFLNQHFSIKDLGKLKYFLGIEVALSNEGFMLSQHKYVIDILRDNEMLGCKPCYITMEQGFRLRPIDKDPYADEGRYHRLLGRLKYLTITRLDITHVLNVLSQFNSSPRKIHMDIAECCLMTRRSCTGYFISLGGSPIS